MTTVNVSSGNGVSTLLDSIAVGNWFIFDGKLHMKVYDSNTNNVFNIEEHVLNSVDLEASVGLVNIINIEYYT